MTSSDPVDRARAIIDACVAEGRNGWRTSYLMRRADVTEAVAREAIDRALIDGAITALHTVICPEAASTIASYSGPEHLPREGQLIECMECNMNANEWHEVYDGMYDVSYGIPGRQVRHKRAQVAG